METVKVVLGVRVGSAILSGTTMTAGYSTAETLAGFMLSELDRLSASRRISESNSFFP